MKRKVWNRGATLIVLAVALLAALLAGLLLGPVARAATPIYVQPDGDDSLCNGTVAVAYSAGVAPNCAVATIQRGIDVVDVGGTVQVGAGTYTPAGGRIIINKSITVQADPSLTVRPKINTNSTSWSSCAIQIAADNVVFQGFEVDNSAAGTLAFYIVGDYNSARNGWTVRDCDIHNGRNAIRPMGNNVTIEGNNLHETQSDLINCEYGTCYGLKVRYNWLHSHHSDLGGKPAGLTYACSSTSPGSWADVEVSYNYVWANRTFIDFQNSGGLSPANQILVAHNTVDYWIGDLPVPMVGTENAQQMSLAWWAGSGNWNAPNFEIRDNLFTRQKWYQVVDTDSLLQGQLVLWRNMFWQWYLNDSWYPSSAYANEWPGPRGAVGWAAMGAGNEFVMNECLTGDPRYAATGTAPDEYYALQAGSPALGSATDGLNIGAWQGQPPVVAGTQVGAITGQVALTRLGLQLTAYVTILDQDGAPQPGLTVVATLTVPGKAPAVMQAVTDAAGQARFTGLTRSRGTWTLCVNDVLGGEVFVPGANDCKSWVY